MNKKLYTVVTLVEAKPGKEKELKKELLKLRELSLEEAECMASYIYECPEDLKKFMLYQNWINLEAHKSHTATPQVKAWAAGAKELLSHPYMTTYWEIIK